MTNKQSDYILQPFEKETIILWNQANEPATIETWDNRLLELLQNEAYATLIKEEKDRNGNILWQKYSLPKDKFTLKKTRTLSDEVRQEKAKRMEALNDR